MRRATFFAAFCALFLLAGTPNLHAQPKRGWLPLISYGCPYDLDGNNNPIGNYWNHMAEVQAAGFNTIYASGATTTDFDTARQRGLHMIQSMYYPYAEGQMSDYDAETNGNCFTNENTVGEDVPENQASRKWARRATTSGYSSGYMVRGLKSPWNREQNVERPGGEFDPLTFFADFWLRTPEDKGGGGKFTVARLEAHAILTDSGDSLLAQRNLYYSELEDSGAVGTTYRPFRLRFTLGSGVESRIQAFDYRLYWNDRADLYVDKITVQDTIFDCLADSGYDAEIGNRICTFNAYLSDGTLFRWYLKDEPTWDQYPANDTLVHKLGVHNDTCKTAPGVLAIIGVADSVDNFLRKVRPDSELLFHLYPFGALTDSNSDYVSPPFTETLQSAFDRVMDSYLVARAKAASHGLEFWLLPQAHEYIVNNTLRLRFPRINELNCHVYLCLAAGAKALFYFVYTSDPGYTPWVQRNLPSKGDDLADTPHHTLGEGKSMDWTGSGSGGLVWYDQKGHDWVKTVTPHGETLWYGVRDVNAVLDSIGSVLATLAWQRTFCATGSEAQNGLVRKVTGSFDPPYIQVAEFEAPDGTPYIELVNRRCRAAESQKANVTINPPDPSVAIYTLTDIYSKETWWIDTEITHTFTGIPLEPGQGRFLVLKAVDVKGEGNLPKHAMHTTDAQSPSFSLGPNYPSPFNESTVIPFSLPIDAHVRLSLFDATGREVRVLVDEYYSAGTHVAVLRAHDLPSGVYICRLSAASYRAARKLVLLK